MFFNCAGSGTRTLRVQYTFWIFYFVPHKISQKVFSSLGHKQKYYQKYLIVFLIVPGAGLEPARFFNRQRILSPSCLPFHHPGTPNKVVVLCCLKKRVGHSRGYLFRLRLTNKLTRLTTTRCFVA